ncbi:hypothetical protein FRC04_004522 [Tulasnella sp. 424]|nr:hypothetical protein FRC04_004522 [Tulasnella sp. 424]
MLSHLNRKQRLYERILMARNAASATTVTVRKLLWMGGRKDPTECTEPSHHAIVANHIFPKISKLLASMKQEGFMEGRQIDLDSGQSEKRYERRVSHIELMVKLVENRESFDPKFWASIAKWQIDTYRRSCDNLLRDYKDSTRDMSDDKDGVEVFIAALEKAVQRAYALPEPDPEKAQISDVFVIRNVNDDPDVQSFIYSDRFSQEKRRALQETVEELLTEQPMFPPACYAFQRR